MTKHNIKNNYFFSCGIKNHIFFHLQCNAGNETQKFEEQFLLYTW